MIILITIVKIRLHFVCTFTTAMKILTLVDIVLTPKQMSNLVLVRLKGLGDLSCSMIEARE